MIFKMNSNIEGFVTSNELNIVKYLAFGTRQLKDESPAFIGSPYDVFAIDFPDDKTYKQFRGCGFNRRNIFIRGVLGFYKMRGLMLLNKNLF